MVLFELAPHRCEIIHQSHCFIYSYWTRKKIFFDHIHYIDANLLHSDFVQWYFQVNNISHSIDLYPAAKTPKIENEAIELLSEEKIIIESAKEIENSDLNQKFYLNEFKLMNEKSAFILDNQVTLRDILLDLQKLQNKNNSRSSCIICVNVSILIAILIVLGLSIYAISLMSNYLT